MYLRISLAHRAMKILASPVWVNPARNTRLSLPHRTVAASCSPVIESTNSASADTPPSPPPVILVYNATFRGPMVWNVVDCLLSADRKTAVGRSAQTTDCYPFNNSRMGTALGCNCITAVCAFEATWSRIAAVLEPLLLTKKGDLYGDQADAHRCKYPKTPPVLNARYATDINVHQPG